MSTTTQATGAGASVRAEISQLGTDMREGDEDTRRYMRVLHEDLVERIKTIGE